MVSVSPKWAEIAHVYESQMFPRAAALPQGADEQLRVINRYLPENKGCRILDAGCGNGKYVRALMQQGYYQVYGVDLFDEVSGLPFYKKASVTDTEYADDWFSFVYSLSVIFYLDDPADAIREYFRILTPGGTLIISCHTRYSLWTLIRVIKRALRLPGHEHLKHVRFLPVWVYVKMLRDAGFEIVETDGFRVSYGMHALSALGFRRSRWGTKARGRQQPRSRLLGYLRALVGYHAIIVSRKPVAEH